MDRGVERLKRVCVYVYTQSHKSLLCSHAQCIEGNEGLDQKQTKCFAEHCIFFSSYPSFFCRVQLFSRETLQTTIMVFVQ